MPLEDVSGGLVASKPALLSSSFTPLQMSNVSSVLPFSLLFALMVLLFFVFLGETIDFTAHTYTYVSYEQLMG